MADERGAVNDLSGELERQVFLALRGAGASHVGQIVERLARDGRPLAYTTVMTVMTRLWEKGYLLRRREGRAYAYEARDEAEIRGELGRRAVAEAIQKFGAPALMGFVRDLSPQQRALVARLLSEGDEAGMGTDVT